MSKGSNLSSPVPMIKLEKFSNSKFSAWKRNTQFGGVEEDQWGHCASECKQPKRGESSTPKTDNKANVLFQTAPANFVAMVGKGKASTEWWLDSGATCHVCNNSALLEDVTAADETVTVANGEIADVLKVGTATLLLSSETDRPTMSWPTRLKIALGSAKGLAYLHEDCNPKIIHRDIKAANILLDYNFEAKVADFGLAKFAPDKCTHVSTRVMGTIGYLAPEYASSGKLTDKSDVFSYGVMLLELITGKQPVDRAVSLDGSLVDWARPLMPRAMEDGYYGDLVDPRLQKKYCNKEMKRMIACAAACVRHSARRRPRMCLVLRALEGGVSLEDLNEGIQPGHSRMHDSYTTNTSSDNDSQRYNEAMQKFRQLALQSQVYGSSEYSGATSEYGLAPSLTSSESQNTREMEMGMMKNMHSFNSS